MLVPLRRETPMQATPSDPLQDVHEALNTIDDEEAKHEQHQRREQEDRDARAGAGR